MREEVLSNRGALVFKPSDSDARKWEVRGVGVTGKDLRRFSYYHGVHSIEAGPGETARIKHGYLGFGVVVAEEERRKHSDRHLGMRRQEGQGYLEASDTESEAVGIRLEKDRG